MTQKAQDSRKTAISREFSARLDRLSSTERVRAIVMLDTRKSEPVRGRQESHLNRKAAMDSIRQSAAHALGDIDSILKPFDGKRLAASPDVLGSIPIETTAAGILALASSEHVKAILEDQSISFSKGLGY